jgi:hypothetical protein
MGTVDAPSMCKVPRKYVKLIAKAFQRTPAAILVEAKIEAAMAISFSFEEFKVQVNGGGNSTGGGSDDTYRLTSGPGGNPEGDLQQHTNTTSGNK